MSRADFTIDQFRYIKIQPKTTDLSTRLWGITTEFVEFIPQSLVLRSTVSIVNFKLPKLVYTSDANRLPFFVQKR